MDGVYVSGLEICWVDLYIYYLLLYYYLLALLRDLDDNLKNTDKCITSIRSDCFSRLGCAGYSIAKTNFLSNETPSHFPS